MYHRQVSYLVSVSEAGHVGCSHSHVPIPLFQVEPVLLFHVKRLQQSRLTKEVFFAAALKLKEVGLVPSRDVLNTC